MLFLSLFFLPVWIGASCADIRVAFSPDLDQVAPLHDLVQVNVAVADAVEGPVDLSLQLWAPVRGRLLTTDFPLVEGTQLVQLNARLPENTLDWSFVFPIRGTYRLELAARDAGGRSWQRTIAVKIKESRVRWLFLGAFLAALFGLGVLAGRLFSGSTGARCVGPVTAALLALGVAKSAGTEVEAQLAVYSPKVGALSQIRWTAVDAGQKRAEPGILDLRIVQSEKGRTVFELEHVASRDDLELGFQFTDASRHLVEAVFTPASGGQVVEIRQIVQVVTNDPALRDRIVPVLLSLLMVAAGVAVGRWSRRRTLRR